ncbi:MAG TPA: hypothetical protein VEP30_07185 [Chthoniobacterales bacterium]|nr:hypothetical protein [Chthoniobacterales bacterium]
MNGGSAKIEIFKPFGEAFELMKKILFQPFNFEKWLVIGFAAFLSGHFAGVGFNFPIGGFPSHEANPNLASADWEQWKPWLAIFIVIFVVLILVLIVVLSWLKARGNFIFMDCIVRNRAAIVAPWREYRREGNSYFLFLLLVMFVSMVIFGLLALIIFVPLGWLGQGVSSDAFTPLVVILLIVLGLAWICFAIFFGVTSYFMIPFMYVRRCRAVEAFREVAGLILQNAGSFILFCLFSICLLLGAAMIGGIATCATCCLAALPYIGTVILLPLFVCLRAFGLCFIRQFGPDYDVWAAIPEASPTPPPIPPPLPS